MPSLKEQFESFTCLVYAEQAKSFLNAYFLDSDIKENAENIWNWTHLFHEFDIENKAKGTSIDELQAHRFLERVGETKRVVEMRDELRSAELEFKRRLTLLEYLLFRFKRQLKDFVNRPQGDNSEEIEKAQSLLISLQSALDAATEQSNKANAEAKIASKAEKEQKAAFDEVLKEEAIRDELINNFRNQSEDEQLGVVARNRAKNQLAQQLSEDSLPLAKAKITLEAATKRAQKARVIAEQAAELAEKARIESEKKCDEAQDYLNEVKAKSGSGGQGSLWWLQRELDEKKKYLPKRLQ